MAKFKHKNGGVAEVFTLSNIERLRKDPNYTEIVENAQPVVKTPPKKQKMHNKIENDVQNEEVVEVEPLQ